jgi:hypothetical protein
MRPGVYLVLFVQKPNLFRSQTGVASRRYHSRRWASAGPMPPRNSASSSRLSTAKVSSPVVSGQRKRPFSRRLAHTHRPLPSQNGNFRRLRCALANRKTSTRVPGVTNPATPAISFTRPHAVRNHGSQAAAGPARRKARFQHGLLVIDRSDDAAAHQILHFHNRAQRNSTRPVGYFDIVFFQDSAYFQIFCRHHQVRHWRRCRGSLWTR